MQPLTFTLSGIFIIVLSEMIFNHCFRYMSESF